MKTNDDEALALLALGERLDLEEGDADAWLSEDPERLDTLAEFNDLLGDLSLALPRQPRPVGGLETLLAATDPATPLRGLERRLGLYFDLPPAGVDALVTSAFDPARWLDAGFFPGLMLFHLDGGPRVAGADAGLVRIPAGSAFPRHRHLGDEYAFVLQGAFTDDQGGTYQRGDVLFMPGDSEHSFDVLPGDDLLYALILYKGVDFSPGGIDLRLGG
ncbi:MAG: cupin domain-containing protein [Polyangiaceae bacterium]|jgi:putative transcriptional regulator|nr:cupin domain-containing protein [Polyangiaceae bacterium]